MLVFGMYLVISGIVMILFYHFADWDEPADQEARVGLSMVMGFLFPIGGTFLAIMLSNKTPTKEGGQKKNYGSILFSVWAVSFLALIWGIGIIGCIVINHHLGLTSS